MNNNKRKSVINFSVDPIWEEAACRFADPEIFFNLDAGSQSRAIAVCDSCPIRIECFNFARDEKLEYGIFGGFTAEERKKIK
jgi:WhiB family redox-sensing transcriptional regulator